MIQNCDNCKHGPADECDKTECYLHLRREIPVLWDFKDEEEEST